MTTETYFLDFSEHSMKPATLPDYSGIYCVYACRCNVLAGTVSFRKLLYIGESEDIRNRVSNHEYKRVWGNELQDNEVLWFSATSISSEKDRKRAEAAMIYHHKPPCNEGHKGSSPFGQTTIKIIGKEPYLGSYFTVYPTAKPQKGLAAGLATWGR